MEPVLEPINTSTSSLKGCLAQLLVPNSGNNCIVTDLFAQDGNLVALYEVLLSPPASWILFLGFHCRHYLSVPCTTPLVVWALSEVPESFLPACACMTGHITCYFEVTVNSLRIKACTSRTCKKLKVSHLRLTVKTVSAAKKETKTRLLWAFDLNHVFAGSFKIKKTYLSLSPTNSIDYCPQETVLCRTCCLHMIEIAFLNQHIIRYSHTGEL